MKRTIHIFLMAALTLAACGPARDLRPAEIETPESLAPARAGYDAGDSASVADLTWWAFYTDSTLCRIIRQTLLHNRDLAVAGARVEELRQLYGADKLNWLPTIDAVVGATRETNDYDRERFVSDTEVSAKAKLNWEIDLWNGLSKQRRKGAATYYASIFDRRAMEMTLIAEAATAYFNLVALNTELNIVCRTLDTRRQALEKARLRFEGGLTSEIVYQQAKVEVATAAAQVPDLERRIQLARNAITLLMGELPDTDFGYDESTLMEFLPRSLPLGLPSELLERRPDLRASEQRLIAAMASAGVAYSNQFPRLTISLTGGLENDEVAHLLKSPFSYLLGNIAGTIFDFGRKRRRYRAAIAEYDQARFSYEKAVLAAFTEVSSAVATYSETQLTVRRRSELCDAAMKYVDLANKQYIGGTINYIDVLDAHRRYFDAQIGLSNAMRDQYLALVNLYKTLGGGWRPG
ncbi:MAG: TolC family protein [Clostridium sp.]|nr:TolC family protein [Clostridium sp.]